MKWHFLNWQADFQNRQWSFFKAIGIISLIYPLLSDLNSISQSLRTCAHLGQLIWPFTRHSMPNLSIICPISRKYLIRENSCYVHETLQVEIHFWRACSSLAVWSKSLVCYSNVTCLKFSPCKSEFSWSTSYHKLLNLTMSVWRLVFTFFCFLSDVKQ